MLYSMRGHILENDGDAQGALRDLTAAADGFRAIGERWGLATSLAALGDAYTKRGDLTAAISALEESLRLLRELNPDSGPAFQRMWLASLRIRTGQPGAREDLERFIAENTDDREGRNAAFGLNMLGDLAREEGKLDEADALYEAGWERQAAAPIGVPQFKAILRTGQTLVAVARDDLVRARALAREAMGYAREGRDMPVVALTAVATVAIAAAEGDAQRAARTLGASDSIRGGPDRSSPDITRLVAELRAALGDAAYAAAYADGNALSRADALSLVDPAR
jgi:tetratricopeptide (TPR) repeat protein